MAYPGVHACKFARGVTCKHKTANLTVGKWSGDALLESLCKLREVNEACLINVHVRLCEYVHALGLGSRDLHIHLDEIY